MARDDVGAAYPAGVESTPLEDYAVIGDMRTLGVVARSGSIDWLCWPRVDSPSVFGRLLDDDGGSWTIEQERPSGDNRQVYLSGTNVLITRFHTDSGMFEVEDLMPVHDGQSVIRSVTCLRGDIRLTSRMSLRPDYGRGRVELRAEDDHAVVTADGLELVASGTVDWTVDGDDLVCSVALAEGETAYLTLGDTVLDRDGCTTLFDATLDYWRSWSEGTTYTGRWREAVQRSALILKLLTNRDSGGIVAAGTTSLPEIIGGERNWDYRYVWIRDAAFTVYAFIETGHLAEAEAFTSWLVARLEDCRDDDTPPLAPLYDLDGVSDLEEIELDHWSGYAHSTPVRIGNAASGQLQLDLYGELVDALYLADKHGDGLSIDTWGHICTLISWLGRHWNEPDDGMWESRAGARRHTSSLMMSWVAVERAIRMANRRGRPAPLVEWQELRDEIFGVLLDEAYDEELGAFTQVVGGDTVDASILLAPLVKFIPPGDPRWRSTLEVVERQLAHGPLVDRYDPATTDDGLDGDEGSFTICSFWYVEALARSGRVREARLMFDRLLSYATPTGLYSEEIGPNGRLLGNFPQAFTHLALISAASHLDQALDDVHAD